MPSLVQPGDDFALRWTLPKQPTARWNETMCRRRRSTAEHSADG